MNKRERENLDRLAAYMKKMAERETLRYNNGRRSDPKTYEARGRAETYRSIIRELRVMDLID